jgi:hypothetical protein
MYRIILASLASFVIVLSCAQRKPATTSSAEGDPQWKKIDSLSNIGQYATALQLTEKILEKAKASGDWRQQFKAQQYRSRFQEMTGVEPKQVIGEQEEALAALGQEGHVPLRQIMHSVLAEAYWDRYQMDRWRILDRTNLENTGDTSSIDTWDQRRFMQQVVHHFQRSLQPFDDIRRIPAGELKELLEWPMKTKRPTGGEYGGSGDFGEPLLVDILARRALSILSNPETRLAEPSWRFQLDQARYFEIYEPFIHRPIEHRDSTSWEFQVLRTYQQWERAHLSDDHPVLLTDIMLDRLRFVRAHSVHPEKDSLYYNALVEMRRRVEKLPAWSEVTVAMAEWHAERGERFQRLDPGDFKWEKRTALQLAEEAIVFPAPFGRRKAEVLKARLTAQQIDLQLEEAVQPGLPFKVALGYTNVKQVWLRIVQDEAMVQGRDKWGEDELKRLLAKKVVKEWSVQLPDDGDLHRHLVELPVDALPPGYYALIASTDQRMRSKQDQVAFANFWCTSIGVAERISDGNIQLMLLDRWNGKALADARAELFILDHERGTRNFTKHRDVNSDPEGRINADVPSISGSHRWVISTERDRYISGQGYYHRGHDEGVATDTLRTFLFTDRAIYRPGQEVFFKGIVTVKRESSTSVKPQYKSELRVFDANGQMVDSISVTSDAFGSFHGSFKAPSGLTGHMRIEEAHGSIGFQVEEYKRPRFEVKFDPIGTTAKLNDTAEVTGMAISYSGVPLDNAEVRWTVKRMARLPWWIGGWWRSSSMWGRPVEIASGTTMTDGNGRYEIEFLAAPDRDLPKRIEPVFTYTIEANVTDISGESQSGNTSLSLGYKSIEIDIPISDAIDRTSVDSLPIGIRNLNGEPAPGMADVKVIRLSAPSQPLRERKWERPDQHVIDEATHQNLFPNDPYANENDRLQWPQESVVLERPAWNSGEENLELADIKNWPVGEYLIEVRAKDPQGEEVVVEQPVTVFDPTGKENAFVAELFTVHQLKGSTPLEPGSKAKFLVASPLADLRVVMEIERNGKITESRPIVLSKQQQSIEIPVGEDDRGGFAVHFMTSALGRSFQKTEQVDVPWTNKQLKVEWMSFRDKLLPGSKEEWRLKISGPKGEQVATQLLASMYDASLGHFVPHQWQMFAWPQNYAQRQWTRMEPFNVANAQVLGGLVQAVRDTTRLYPGLRTFEWPPSEYFIHGIYSGGGGRRNSSRLESFEVQAAAPMKPDMEAANGMVEAKQSDGQETVEPAAPPNPQPVRADFRETAFFFPDLLTDRDGSIVLRFTAPESLTRWKMMGLAHTADLKVAQFEREVITQKPLMVAPNLPRFLREGDRMKLVTKINALETSVGGAASIEFFDPYTNSSITHELLKSGTDVGFTTSPGSSASASWSITIPSRREMIGVRIIAKGNNGISDGEEHVLPVLTDRLLVTESLPLPIRKAGTKSFTLDKLKNNTSTTLQHHALKLEFTPNPAWYAVQALPYLIEFPHECSEQVFSRYFANKISAHIVQQRPEIRKVVDQWKSPEKASALLSNLQKNSELKTILLEETPWVMRARDENERKERLVLLFDMERMAREEASSLKKLQELQRQDGAWPWFGGMFPSRDITQHIVGGIGHLQKLGAADLRKDVAVQQMLDRAIQWLDQDVDRWYEQLLRNTKKEQLAHFVPGYSELHYLYARSFHLDHGYSAGAAQAARFIQQQLSKHWLKYGLQEQAMIALVLNRIEGKDTEVPELILKSLKERATQHDELGMYWKNFTPGMEWWSFPTETHSLAIEAFHEIVKDAKAVDGLRVHLLKLKQTSDWRTTKATAAACYALLLTGPDLLDDFPAPAITVGEENVTASKAEAGTGYFTQTWNADQVKSDMGEVTVTASVDRVSWGALHWQYFEQMDKITPHESPFNIRKQVMLRRQTDEGVRLLTLEEAGKLRTGDRLTIRVELRTDRYVDFVHLKDLRAAGLEPVDAISGHRWQGGLGYYLSIRDASMNFFFDRIPPGTHVFEYELKVAHEGDFSNGITTAMCMYAPEFSSHSSGQRIVIGE